MRCSCQPLCLLQIVLLTKRRSRSRLPFRKQPDARHDDAIQSISRLGDGVDAWESGMLPWVWGITTVFCSLLQLIVTATLATTSCLVSFSSRLHHPITHSRHHRPGSSRIPTSSPTTHRAQPAVRHRLAGVLLPLPTRYLRLRAHSLPQPPRADTNR